MRPTTMLIASLACLLPLAASADHHKKGEHGGQDIPKEAVAKLIPTIGNTVNGIIVLTQKGEDVHVTGEVWNLSPGEHGFHIHEYGDLRAGDGTSAGGHYNPDGHPHAGPDAEKHHAGDLGNITAGRDGRAKVDKTAKGLKLHFVIGRSIVVHAGRDDLQSQPSGDAGPRVALGVIGFAQVKEGTPQNEPHEQVRRTQTTRRPSTGQPNQPAPEQPEGDRPRSEESAPEEPNAEQPAEGSTELPPPPETPQPANEGDQNNQDN